MDESLLRILQSIKRIEDDPAMQFETKTIDLATFIPKYENVVVVDQQWEPSESAIQLASGTGSFAKLASGILSPEIQPSESRFVTNRLSVALEVVLSQCILNSSSGWTIILKEGLFIHPFDEFILRRVHLSEMGTDTDFFPTMMMEIIGLQDVRILLTNNTAMTFISKQVNLMMRNIRIYDFREEPCLAFAMITVKSDCRLEDVKIYAPQIRGVNTMQQGSQVYMKGCSLNATGVGVCHGDIRAENCLIMGHCLVYIIKGATFSADQVSFRGGSRISGEYNSKCVLDRCKFEAAKGDDSSDSNAYALQVRAGTDVDCKRTTFSGYGIAVSLFGSGTSVSCRNCNFFCSGAPFAVELNANLFVADSFVLSAYYLLITCNVKGKVELLRNSLGPLTECIIQKDSISRNPIVDRHDVTYIVEDLDFQFMRTDKKAIEICEGI